jgi:hypothetical protein
MPDSTALRTRLTAVLDGFPEVEAAFLFGSVAEGRAGLDSDLDLGLVPAQGDLRARRLDILTALAAAGFDRVDLLLLDDGAVVPRFEAVRLNQLVYARAGFDLGTYYSRALREYLDFLPYLARQRAALKARLTGGTP